MFLIFIDFQEALVPSYEGQYFLFFFGQHKAAYSDVHPIFLNQN
jgi:hypothetical protein